MAVCAYAQCLGLVFTGKDLGGGTAGHGSLKKIEVGYKHSVTTALLAGPRVSDNCYWSC